MRSTVLAVVVSVVIGGGMKSKAVAFDATGTWQGTRTCNLLGDDGLKRTQIFKNDVLQITQNGSNVRLHWETKDGLYVGVSFPVATDPNRNQIGFRRCGVTNDPTTTGEMGRARVIL